MATFLDVLFLENFSPVFVFLLVFAVLYAILQATKVLGENKGLSSLIAIVISFLIMMSPDIVKIITSMLPSFFLVILFILLVLILFRFLGMSESTISGSMQKWGPLHTTLIVVVAIIFAITLAGVYGSKLLSLTAGGNATNASGYGENIAETVFHPKVLGLLVIFIIAIFAIVLLVGGAAQEK